MRYLDCIEKLETFLILAELKSFRKAAEQLNISKASVSRRISSLEKDLGSPLFIRDSEGSILTAFGCQFIERAKPLLLRFKALSTPSISKSLNQRGTIRISAPSALGNGLLIPWIAIFQKNNPEIFIDLTLTLGPVHIMPAECDIRINHGLYPCSNALIRKLGDMRRMMVASVAYLSENGCPKSPADLEKHALLGGNDLLNGSPLILLKGNERAIVPYHPRLKLKDHTAARNAALAGAGISVHAFRYDTLELVRKNLLIHVLPEWEPAPSPVSLLLPIKKKKNSAADALCAFIEEKWQANPELTYFSSEDKIAI